MRISFRLLTTAATVLTFAAPYAVHAQGDPFQSKDPIAVYVEAGATPDQQKQIRTLAKEFESSARIKIERASNLMKKMQQLSLEPNPDEKLVLNTQSELNVVQSDLGMARIKLMLQIRSVLDGEQRQRLVQLLKERRPGSQPGM